MLPIGRRGIELAVDSDLAREIESSWTGSMDDFFASPLEASRDRDEIASRLDSGEAMGGIAVVPLDSSLSIVHGRSDPPAIGISRALLEIGDPAVRSVLLRVAFARQIREFALARAGGSPGTGDGGLKKDVGVFLLLLADHAGEALYLGRIIRELSTVLRRESPFIGMLVPFLSKLPFVETFDPAESEYGRVFLDPSHFDRLGTGAKLSAVAGGVLAWYSVLSLKALRAFAPAFRAASPYYEPAYRMLRVSFRREFLLKRGFISRGARSLLRGDVLQAVEFFWSGWNPVLARLTTRPVYRMLGGNRRPVYASTMTFIFTSLVVHPLWLVLGVLSGLRIAVHFNPGFRAGEVIASPGNFIVVGGAIAAYAFFGFVSGLAKLMRKRRGKAGTDPLQ